MTSLLLMGSQAVNAFSTYRIAPVTSDGMAPTIPQGSLVVSKLADESTIKAGDIVTIGLGKQNTNLIGRVLSITSDDNQYYSIQLKGDQRALPDNFPYKTKDVTYKEQFSIPLIGYATSFLASPAGLITMTGLMLIAGWLYIFKLHSPVPKQEKSVAKTRKARQIAIQRIETRGEFNGVEKIKSFFVESEVS